MNYAENQFSRKCVARRICWVFSVAASSWRRKFARQRFERPADFRDNHPMNIILCADLLFSTKITATAKAQGAPFVVARTLEKLQQALDGAPAGSTLIVDLNTNAVDVPATIALARAHLSQVKIIGFVSHVDADLAAAARATGAHQVLARSAFVNQLESLLTP